MVGYAFVDSCTHASLVITLSAGLPLPLGVLPPPTAITSVPETESIPPTAYPSSLIQPLRQSGNSGQSSVSLSVFPPLPPASSLGSSFTQSGMILSPASDPIPHRLVQRIQAGDFVEMQDLLVDNIALHNQLDTVHGPLSLASTPPALRPWPREVPSLGSWMYCFAAYVTVRTRDPQTQDMLAYCRLIIREALRHGNNGWQHYDRSFHRQAAIDHSISWNNLSPGLQATTLLGNRGEGGTSCTICWEPDHVVANCALALMQQPLHPAVPAHAGTQPTGVNARLPVRPPRRPETLIGICASWNHGRCILPGHCKYKHICAVCQLDHMGIQCPDAPEGSEYHRLQVNTKRKGSGSSLNRC